jgi:hypothetical protein
MTRALASTPPRRSPDDPLAPRVCRTARMSASLRAPLLRSALGSVHAKGASLTRPH